MANTVKIHFICQRLQRLTPKSKDRRRTKATASADAKETDASMENSAFAIWLEMMENKHGCFE